MISSKPVGDTDRSTDSVHNTSSDEQELEKDWDTCDEPDLISEDRAPHHDQTTAEQLHDTAKSPVQSSFAPRKIPQSSNPSSFTEPKSPITDTPHDHGIGQLSLGPPNNSSSPKVESLGSNNPFRQKHSPPITPARQDASAAFWYEASEPTFVDRPSQDSMEPALATRQYLAGHNDRESLNDFKPGSAVASGSHKGPAALPSSSKGKGPILEEDVVNDEESIRAATAKVETSRAKANRQTNEVYQIKIIRWHDTKAAKNPRTSPILIQNANGPCPLLALVNALSLSTPSHLMTPLLETLRTREQISLGLLLDAVFEELMSDRRSGNSPDLPDVGDLYAFLITLHTGMNVNPQFVETPSRNGQGDDEGGCPGAFEDTREMKLYSTFQIPLIHGWIPHKHELAYRAFDRIAPTYEDAQNIQFREEELLQKLGSEKLATEDQNLLEDLTTIKGFFTYWPTQLTGHGLDVMKRSVKPGQMCILFRNDHFSMLYKEPRSNRLMTLVTDAGYATHDEIVWESLVDINGSKSEWFSGDFRSVSHETPVGDAVDQSDWTTVDSKRRNDPDHGRKAEQKVSDSSNAAELLQSASAGASGAEQRSASEQEDMDLAIALQLQEEEEERERNETQKRLAHENKLSRNYIEQQSQQPATTQAEVQIPPRRSGGGRPGVNRNESPDGDAPPSYEQAASDPPYHPSNGYSPRAGSSAHAQQTAAVGRSASNLHAQRRMSARQSLANNQINPRAGGGYQSRRPARIETGMGSANGGLDRDDKCNVM